VQVKELKENLFLVSFDPIFLGEVLNYNIVLLLNDKNEAMLIDTGFKRHFNQLKKYLDDKNITIIKVIITHFHRDHIGGLSKLNDVVKYGSKKADITLAPNFENKSFDIYKPTICIDDVLDIQFGNFDIHLSHNPGHSIDGLLVEIDNKFLVVGDDMIYTKDQEPMLPYCSNRDFEMHLKSIKRLKNEVIDKTVIPMHGQPESNIDYLQNDLDNRYKYLQWKVNNKDKQNKEFEIESGIRFVDYSRIKKQNKKEL